MSETPRRYTPKEFRDAADSGDSDRGTSDMLRSAAEDASRLEQIEQWVSVQMSEGELRGYLPDLRKFLSSSAGRREET